MSSSPECHSLPQGFEFDSYRIDQLLSQGGFSFVYLAHDAAGTPVVIKEYLPAHLVQRPAGAAEPHIPPENLGSFNRGLRSFLEEARLLARIRHPNIVAVLNFAKANHTAYLVMRHETGHTLEAHMVDLRKRGVAIDEAFLRLVFVRLLSGLREVHKEKLLHLDLKPANIFLRQDGNPVLLDFGAARWGLGAADSSLGYVYTPGFAAPEQQGSGEALGPWTDIYAIGATLYACLDGGVIPLAAKMRPNNPALEPAQSRWAGRYSLQLLELIDWCMQLAIDRRPQSVHALQKSLNGELLEIVDPNWFQS